MKTLNFGVYVVLGGWPLACDKRLSFLLVDRQCVMPAEPHRICRSQPDTVEMQDRLGLRTNGSISLP